MPALSGVAVVQVVVVEHAGACRQQFQFGTAGEQPLAGLQDLGHVRVGVGHQADGQLGPAVQVRIPGLGRATSKRSRSSATTGRTTERFSFSECTSPSRQSAISTPTTMPPALPSTGSALTGDETGEDPRPGDRRRGRGPCGRVKSFRPYARTGPSLVAVSQRLRPRLLPHLERLDHVIDLDVVVRPEADTALVAVADLGRVVLEPRAATRR